MPVGQKVKSLFRLRILFMFSLAFVGLCATLSYFLGHSSSSRTELLLSSNKSSWLHRHGEALPGSVEPPLVSVSGNPSPKTCPFIPPSSAQVEAMLSTESVQKLTAIASRFNKSRPVVLIMSDRDGGYLVANWLCAARIAVKKFTSDNVLVVASDKEANEFADLLTKHGGLHALQVHFKCEEKSNSSKVVTRSLTPWQRALTQRTLIVMLLTHWGLDVFVTDPDALLIRDPFPILSHIIQSTGAHIVAQKGHMPANVRHRWGFTLVLGSIYYRSTTYLDPLWTEIFVTQFGKHTVDLHISTPNSRMVLADDQKLLNIALTSLDLRWRNSSQRNLYNSTFGQTPSGLKVVALDSSYSFRGSLSELKKTDKSNILVYHPATKGHETIGKLKQLDSLNVVRMSVTEKGFEKYFLRQDTTTDLDSVQFLNDVCESKKIELS